MGLEGGGKTDIAQQDADAGSFQAEATGLLHAGQATKPAQGHESTAKSALHDASTKPVSHDASIEPASPPSALKPGDSAARLESGMLPGLNTDHLHNSARELLFQHNSHGVPVAFQPHNDVASAGLPQINIFNSSNQTELHTGVQNNLALHNNEIAPPHDAPPAPTDGKQPSPQNGEIKVENYAVKKGDSLWKIARENLEPGASNRGIANYVHQIEAGNPMHDPNLIMPGQIIKLRGYASATEHDTAHGAERHETVRHYRSGSHNEHRLDHDSRTYPYPQGNHSQHDSENQHGGNGNDHQSPTTHHKAAPQHDSTKDTPLPPPQPHNDAQPPLPQHQQPHDKSQDNPPVKDLPNKPLEPLKINPAALNIEQDRQQLAELAHNRMGDSDEYHKFVDSMYTFEHRADSEMVERLHLQGKSPEEAAEMVTQQIHDTYKNAGDLLRSPGTDKLTSAELQHLASEEIQQAAHPADIDQGQYPTCQTIVMEKRIYAREPSKATDVVTQVALTGKYTAPGGATVSIDPTPHDMEAATFPIQSNKRSLASQIFEQAAINATWAKIYPGVRYEWLHNSDALPKTAKYRLMSDGKRVTSRDNLKIPAGEDGIFRQDYTLMSNLITGEHENSVVIPLPSSPQELESKVKDLKEAGELPAVLEVNTAGKPFSTYAKQLGYHTVLIDDYIPAKNGHQAEAVVDNSWGFLKHTDSRTAAGPMDFQLLYHASAKATGN